ncbi:hypothetical protein SELSPUOL_01899 [Selenomonas sputigena ATCC 35185]|uniref:Uncharacterized protein n=1 Tax=Selenomonas sputigena (strain ATCC 35185 / DSM 20758 / CCUG 44933 / VPI D19B-28) TaxID=546271 RepID=C9LWP4_SELS3|nr:hypothetical protein SELSPUOL_01899 [Selenomonas sputigena ATCC 35185]
MFKMSSEYWENLLCDAAYHGIIYRRRVQQSLEAVRHPAAGTARKGVSQKRCQQQSWSV